MRSVCSRSRLRRRASSRVMIRSETTRSTSSSVGQRALLQVDAEALADAQQLGAFTAR